MLSTFSTTVQRSRQRRLPMLGVAAVGIAAASLAFGAPAYAAASSTTVTPAGDAFQANLAAGVTADFTVGTTTVSCATSSSDGQVPAAPDNVNAAGPVTSALTPPTFADCSTNSVLLSASTTTNDTNGSWSIALQYDPAGSTGTLSIPAGGVVVTTGGLATCTVTVSPDAAYSVTGAWTPGTDTALPQLAFDAVTVPVTVTGGLFCPTSATSATFSATYDISDTTDPTQQVAVTS